MYVSSTLHEVATARLLFFAVKANEDEYLITQRFNVEWSTLTFRSTNIPSKSLYEMPYLTWKNTSYKIMSLGNWAPLKLIINFEIKKSYLILLNLATEPVYLIDTLLLIQDCKTVSSRYSFYSAITGVFKKSVRIFFNSAVFS